MRAAPYFIVALQAVSAFGGNNLIMNYFRIQAMGDRFSQDLLDKNQQNALMKQSSDQIGDMELFMSNQLTASEYKGSLKQQMKDRLLNQMINAGNVDINNPVWQKVFFGNFDKEKIYTVFGEPTATIMRLMQDTRYSAEGKRLMKRYQYRKFNRRGNAITENMEYLLHDNDGSKLSRKDKIKKLLDDQLLRNFKDPLDRAIVHTMRKYKAETDSAKQTSLKTQLSDLQKVKVLQPSIPASSPITSNDLFTFFRLTKSEVSPGQILNIALNDSYTPLSRLDFERYFGSSAKQFSCRAHAASIRIPCKVAPTAQECISFGCCWLPDTKNPTAPKCYQDLYANIEMGLLRSSFVMADKDRKDHITKLFNGNQIPTLDYILQDEVPRGADLSAGMQTERQKMYGGTAQNKLNLVDRTTLNWWEAAKVTYDKDPNGDDTVLHAWGTGGIHDQSGPRPAYGNPYAAAWKPHDGPTQSPYFNRLPGVNPTANPTGTGTLDEFYQLWLSYAASQDEAQCALIKQSDRIKCMENYEAIVDSISAKANSLLSHKDTACYKAGCCFNEDSFLAGGFACYRARDYGTCNNIPDNFVKRQCFDGPVDEETCLSNAQCCYKPSRYTETMGTPQVQHKGEPWCFYKFSATLEEDQWCDAYQQLENQGKIRLECFDTADQKFMKHDKSDPFYNTASNFNNLVGEEACVAAGCCYDRNLSRDIREWAVNGLGKVDNMLRCFKKRNPAVAGRGTAWEKYREDAGFINVLIDHDKEGGTADTGFGTVKDLKKPNQHIIPVKTCQSADWDKTLNMFKRDCGNLSYRDCVHRKGCCYMPTTMNEPHCYHPEFKQKS
jgi:hypothetical protein